MGGGGIRGMAGVAVCLDGGELLPGLCDGLGVFLGEVEDIVVTLWSGWRT